MIGQLSRSKILIHFLNPVTILIHSINWGLIRLVRAKQWSQVPLSPLLAISTKILSIMFKIWWTRKTSLIKIKRRAIELCQVAQTIQITLKSCIFSLSKTKLLKPMAFLQVTTTLKMLLLPLLIQLKPREALHLLRRIEAALPTKKQNVWQKAIKSLMLTNAAK